MGGKTASIYFKRASTVKGHGIPGTPQKMAITIRAINPGRLCRTVGRALHMLILRVSAESLVVTVPFTMVFLPIPPSSSLIFLLQPPYFPVGQPFKQCLAKKRLCRSVDAHHHIQVLPRVFRQIGGLHAGPVLDMPSIDLFPVEIVNNDLEISV